MVYTSKIPNPDILESLEKDVDRADLGNGDFSKCPNSGENSLYNVLNAYASFDPEIGYCQGMNIVVSWILKFMRYFDHESLEMKYDEPNSFYLLCYIMIEL